MKKKFLFPFLVASLLITACGGGEPSSSAQSSSESSSSSQSDSSGTSSSSASSSSSQSSSSIDDRKAAEYEASLGSWSQPGHLYLHYLRTTAEKDSDYDDWGIWMWPNAPQDLEGTLWGAVNQASLATVPYPMSQVRSARQVDDYGAIYDIDLTRTDLKGGKTGEAVTFEDCTKVGFLVVKLSSMGGKTHWTSDGGANIYIEEFDTHWRKENGKDSMHLFLTQGDVANYTFTAGGVIDINPTISDTTGAYRSVEKKINDKYAGKTPKTSSDFAKLGVGYQIFVASFRDSNGDGMGDLQGVIDALPHLQKLNVQCIWLTPVFKCESYHGYDTVDYYSIDSRFGDMETFENLLKACKDAKIKVILDLVLNHTSKNHTWYRNSQKAAVSEDPALGKEVEWRNIYHWKFKGDKVQYYDHSKGKYTTINVEKHPDWYQDGESNYYYYGKFGSGMPELNYDNQATRDLVIALGNYWLDKGVDGFRLDAVKHIYMKDEVKDSSGDVIVPDIGSKSAFDDQLLKFVNKSFDYSSDVTRNVNFWKEFSFGLKNKHSGCFLVGENYDGYGARIAPYYQALDSQFDFSNFFHIDEWVYQGKDSKSAKAYGTDQVDDSYAYYRSSSDNSDIWADGSKIFNGNYPTGHRGDFINGAFTSNHDTLRAINHASAASVKEVELKDKDGKVIKDDKGNVIKFKTSKVSNSSAEVGKAKVAAAMTILNSGLSWIYYGDEIGMSSNTDTHIELYGNPNNEDMWYRQPFKWGDSKVTTGYKFNNYTVQWDSNNKKLDSASTQDGKNGSMLKYYQALCEIKAKFGTDQKFVGKDSGKTGLVYWQVQTSNGTYNVYINTKSSDIGYSATGSYVGKAGGDSTSSSIKAYSAYVTKS